ncbi:MAG: hypothetical protein LIQ31_08165 [Planctomycetes bacterium]|nr:hypothetical protein [Planctomycetota bacterium]
MAEKDSAELSCLNARWLRWLIIITTAFCLLFIAVVKVDLYEMDNKEKEFIRAAISYRPLAKEEDPDDKMFPLMMIGTQIALSRAADSLTGNLQRMVALFVCSNFYVFSLVRKKPIFTLFNVVFIIMSLSALILSFIG